ncbi:MAG: hypothetical protein GY799_20970 [Desulfobulbaceae bacterium]|nr:hypothetical protein [Desulfobulbaceae bacterium]
MSATSKDLVNGLVLERRGKEHEGFRIGDRVERLLYPNSGFAVGEVREIESFSRVGSKIWPMINGGVHDPRLLKLVEEIEEFEVIAPFDIFDIRDHNPSSDEFARAKKELGLDMILNMGDLRGIPVLAENVAWLERKGFLRRTEEKRTLLDNGMELSDGGGSEIRFFVVDSGQDGSWGGFQIYMEVKGRPHGMYDRGRLYPEGTYVEDIKTGEFTVIRRD